MTPGAGLRVDGLGVERGGVTVLRDLDLAVGGGECVVVAGAAGTGKTSLAADVAAAVVDLARAEAGRGAAVLWLDAPGAATPAPPRLNLAGGRLVAAPGGSM